MSRSQRESCNITFKGQCLPRKRSVTYFAIQVSFTAFVAWITRGAATDVPVGVIELHFARSERLRTIKDQDQGSDSQALAVSADGSVVVGQAFFVLDPGFVNGAFRWTANEGIEPVAVNAKAGHGSQRGSTPRSRGPKLWQPGKPGEQPKPNRMGATGA